MFVISDKELENLDKWSFNIFKVAEFSNNRPLSCIMYAIFQVKNIKKNIQIFYLKFSSEGLSRGTIFKMWLLRCVLRSGIY